jgi:hypothetical protein
MRRQLTITWPLVLLVIGLFVNVPTASAATYTVNLAGRPVGGSSSTSCQGLSYGRVNNNIVLFTAAHCRDLYGGQGGTVHGPGG